MIGTIITDIIDIFTDNALSDFASDIENGLNRAHQERACMFYIRCKNAGLTDEQAKSAVIEVYGR